MVMANTGLLILTNPFKVKKLLPLIKKNVLKTLYIQYFPDKNLFPFDKHEGAKIQHKTIGYAQTIANIYTMTSNISTRLDVRVLLNTIKNPDTSTINTRKPVELVIFDKTYSKTEANNFIQDYLGNTVMSCNFLTFNDDNVEEKYHYESSDEKNRLPIYKNVVLGGTFDRIHNGHKIFLSEAVLRCTEKLTVGVTDVNMLSGKILWELIEPCQDRIRNLRDFLEDVDSSIKYNIVPINDIYGPTKTDALLEMIVVSEETKRGGEKVNDLRSKMGMSNLDICVVKLIPEENYESHEEKKISSSNQRIRLLGTKLKYPNLESKNLKPYIIGLTGGIASGKSSVAEKLQNLGAGLVNCDKLAHRLYLPGGSCFELIIKNFGNSILNEEGLIDRKILGEIVFNDKAQLEKLNTLVWPVILNEAKNQINKLFAEGFNIIIMEAAVLIQANWQNACHEIWTCIIPAEEAVKRAIQRGLSKENVEQRIRVQPSNQEQVLAANVVFCTLWSHDVTYKQVKTAWNELNISLYQ